MANPYYDNNLARLGGFDLMQNKSYDNFMDAKLGGLLKQMQQTNNLVQENNLMDIGVEERKREEEKLAKKEARMKALREFGDRMEIINQRRSGNPQIAAALQQQMDARKLAEQQRIEAAQRKAKQEQLLASMNPEQRRIYETYGREAAYDYEFNKPERKIIEGADGFKYYLDGSRVLPNIGIKKDKGDVFKAENDLRDEHQKLSGTFIDVRDAYGRILSNAEKQTAASDLSLIFNYMKMLDPGSVVREGEFANAQNSAGVGDQVRAKYNSILSGERLAENTRKDFIQTAKLLYQTQLASQNLLDKNYENLSKAYGLDPNNVILDFTKEIADKEFGYNLSIMSNDQLATLDEKNYNEDQIELIKKELEKRLK